ncbi:hypothetical protein [Nonomuraea wenchangensis]|uniref:hypothetical protein n=1 Tax=Nonomuraea wenchangensis TaxID=568860 RepID=UPI00343A8614
MSELDHGIADLNGDQAAVFQAVSYLESGPAGPGDLEQIARRAGLGRERASRALDELLGPLGLVTAVEDPSSARGHAVYRVQSLG